jgi:hypothetical protein
VLEVDWTRHVLINHSQQAERSFEVYSQADRDMLAAGGIMAYLKHTRQKDST